MYIATVTKDYDKITSSNITDYRNMTQTYCTDNEYNNDISRPTILFTIPSGSIIFMFFEFDCVYLK